MQGELSFGDAPPACISSTRNYLRHLAPPAGTFVFAHRTCHRQSWQTPSCGSVLKLHKYL